VKLCATGGGFGTACTLLIPWGKLCLPLRQGGIMKLKKRLSIVAVSIALVGGALAATGVATATTPTTTYYACSAISGASFTTWTHICAKCLRGHEHLWNRRTAGTTARTGPTAGCPYSAGVPSNPCTTVTLTSILRPARSTHALLCLGDTGKSIQDCRTNEPMYERYERHERHNGTTAPTAPVS